MMATQHSNLSGMRRSDRRDVAEELRNVERRLDGFWTRLQRLSEEDRARFVQLRNARDDLRKSLGLH